MKERLLGNRLLVGSCLLAAVALASTPAHSQSAGIIGSWQGTSLCVDKTHFPACNNEQVIYDVRAHGSRRDSVTLRADKIVNGVRDFMGEFDFAYSADSSWVARVEVPRGKIRIVVRVRAAHMTGFMMEETSQRRVREMALDRVVSRSASGL